MHVMPVVESVFVMNSLDSKNTCSYLKEVTTDTQSTQYYTPFSNILQLAGTTFYTIHTLTKSNSQSKMRSQHPPKIVA